MASKIITAARAAANEAMDRMALLNNAHTVECIKLKVAIKSANGNIYKALTQKENAFDPK